jgi:hypothetical protein
VRCKVLHSVITRSARFPLQYIQRPDLVVVVFLGPAIFRDTSPSGNCIGFSLGSKQIQYHSRIHPGDPPSLVELGYRIRSVKDPCSRAWRCQGPVPHRRGQATMSNPVNHNSTLPAASDSTPDDEARRRTSHHAEGQVDKVSQAGQDPLKDDEDIDYPKGLRLALLLLSVFVSMFLVALDRLIISTAIPQITDEFQSLQDVGWYGSAFLLTQCCFQLMFGKLYTLFAVKTVFLSTIVLFEAGSALCGAAPNSVAFIIGRAIQGVGSAGVFSGVVSPIVRIIDLSLFEVLMEITRLFALSMPCRSISVPLFRASSGLCSGSHLFLGLWWEEPSRVT